MYANESPGEKWPVMDWSFLRPPYGTGDEFDFAGAMTTEYHMRMHTVYPEYLTDPAILACPSDASNNLVNQPDLGCVSYVSDADVDPPVVAPSPTFPAGQCRRVIDESYTYFGYVIDKCGADDPTYDPSFSGYYPEFVGLEACSQLDSIGNEGGGFFAFVFGAGNPDQANTVFDLDATGVGTALGNANTETINRLREGIERFLITDINNPAASAVGQSEIWVSFDNFSAAVGKFNHVPGGSNVLYLDGHVEFVRYTGTDGEQPINDKIAAFIASNKAIQ